MSQKHCATCRCAVTITGQVEAFLSARHRTPFTTGEIASGISYVGEHLQATLDRMARHGDIHRVRPGVYRASTLSITADLGIERAELSRDEEVFVL